MSVGELLLVWTSCSVLCGKKIKLTHFLYVRFAFCWPTKVNSSNTSSVLFEWYHFGVLLNSQFCWHESCCLFLCKNVLKIKILSAQRPALVKVPQGGLSVVGSYLSFIRYMYDVSNYINASNFTSKIILHRQSLIKLLQTLPNLASFTGGHFYDLRAIGGQYSGIIVQQCR